MRESHALSCGMMALVGALWGLHGPAVKLAFAAGFAFPEIVFGEYLVAAVAFGLVVARQARPWPRDRAFWIRMIAAAVIGCGVPLFLFWAYQLGPVSIGATLLFLYVPFTQLFNALATRRAPPPREIVSALLVLAGAAVAADFAGSANAANLRGAPFAVLAALCFAAFFTLTARLGGQGTPALRSLVTCVVAGLVLLGLAPLVGWSLVPDAPAPAKAAVWLLALGVLGQVIPVFLMVQHGPRVGSGLGSILTSTELPVAVLAAALLLGDPVGAAQIAGVLLVLVGIALPHFGARAPAPVA